MKENVSGCFFLNTVYIYISIYYTRNQAVARIADRTVSQQTI